MRLYHTSPGLYWMSSWNYFLGIAAMNAVGNVFRFLCLVATIVMCIYCTLEFARNKDLSEISTGTFNEENGVPYPQVLICFLNPFKERELETLGFNSTSYGEFLRGEIWNEQMVNVSIEKIQVKLEEQVIDSCITSTVVGKCESKGNLSTFMFPWGPQCLQFHYRYPKRITTAQIWIKSSIFANGVIPPVPGFSIGATFPNQALRSPISSFPMVRGNWNDTDDFSIDVEIYGVEVLKRRNKRGRVCSENINYEYDSVAFEKALEAVGCRPYYLQVLQKYPPCNTKEKMLEGYNRLLKVVDVSQASEDDIPPCSELEKMQILTRMARSDLEYEKVYVKEVKDKLEDVSRWFRLSVQFRQNTYRQITQVRAYNLQSLIGNAGGYVGLFVGYTISELPSTFETIRKHIMRKS